MDIKRLKIMDIKRLKFLKSSNFKTKADKEKKAIYVQCTTQCHRLSCWKLSE